MPYEVSWYRPNRIIYERVYGELTLNEVQGTVVEIERMLEEGTSPIHLIVDMRELDKVKVPVKEIANVSRSLRSTKLGWVLLLSTGKPLLDFLASVVSQVTRMQLAKRASLDQVDDFLLRQDASLSSAFAEPRR